MYHGRGSSIPKVASVQGCSSHCSRIHGEPHLTMSRGANGASQQATALEAEGVQVTRGSLGEYSVDFATYGWFPDILPSDLSDEDDEE